MEPGSKRSRQASGAVQRRRAVVALIALISFIAGMAVAASSGKGTDVKESSTSLSSAAARHSAELTAETLSDRQLVGQRLIAGVTGTTVTPQLRSMIRRGETAGVILFADNFPSRAAGRRLIARLQAIKRPARLQNPLLIMADQEGGLVKRLSGAPNTSAAEMGRQGATFSLNQGRKTARNLRNVGVNVNLAPVVDVGRSGGDIAGTDRAFGSTPAEVLRSAIPFARGLEQGGVAATAKHFPGLGAARRNTDFAAQTIRISKPKLRRIDLAPYRSFIAAGGDLVMLSTAIYPAFSNKPAAFTRQIVTGELRKRLGFTGVSITDAMGTVAVRNFGATAKATLSGARAGVDLLLYTDQAAAARAGRVLLRRLRSGKLDRKSFQTSAERVLLLRAGL